MSKLTDENPALANQWQAPDAESAPSVPVPNPSEAGAPGVQASPGLHAPGQDPRTGKFLPGNAVGRKHGLLAASLAPVLAEERAAFLAGSLADDGGAADCPTRRRSLHVYRSRLHIHITQISDAIETFGLFDKRGRLRAAWLQRLEGLLARATAIDATLGLGRYARHIPTSLTEAMAQAPELDDE